MTVREKALISSVCIALLYVLYSISSDKRAAVKRTSDRRKVTSHLNNLVNDIVKESEAQGISSIEQHIISRAEREIGYLPFVSKADFLESIKKDDSKLIKKKDAEKKDTTPVFFYNGYVDMGGEKMAVINGKEYKEGEEIGSYTIEKIGPSFVLLRPKTGKSAIRIKYKDKV